MRLVPERHVRRGVAVAGVLAAGALASACSSSASSPLSAGQILKSSRDARVVHLTLDAALTSANSGFNFDGYGSGAMTIDVPVGWKVDVTCTNESTTFTHSCAVVTNATPSTSGAPFAFPGSVSANPVHGLAHGVTSTFSFVASRVGTYRIACLVTAHELDGMWDWFDVTRGGTPRVRFSR